MMFGELFDAVLTVQGINKRETVVKWNNFAKEKERNH